MQARQPSKHSRLFLVLAYIVLAWVLPLIISIGRILSSAGSAAFVFPKFMDFVTSWEQHPNTNSTIAVPHNTTSAPQIGCSNSGSNQPCMTETTIAAASAAVAFNVIVNLMTRIPVVFYTLRKRYQRLEAENGDNENNNDVTTPTDTHESASYFDFKGMTLSSGLIYAGLKGINLTSGAFNGLSTYLSIKSLIEFLEHCLLHTNIGEDHPDFRIALYESAAIFFAVTSMANYFIFNIRASGDENAKTFAINITNRHCPSIDRAFIATALLASPATLCVGPMAFFTTFNALKKICWVAIPVNVRYITAGVSFVTAATARILTDVPSMYHMVKSSIDPKKEKPVNYTGCQAITYKTTVYTAGVGDSANACLSNFTGVINTIGMLTPVSQHNPVLLTAAGICAISSGGLNYAFGIYNGSQRGMPLFFKSAPVRQEYQAVATDGPTIVDIEEGIAVADNNKRTTFNFPPASSPIDIDNNHNLRTYLAAST